MTEVSAVSSEYENEALGSPGIEPKWTHSSKDGVGTAYSTSSNVWFALSHGILNEIYYPTIDHPQPRDLELLITDGQTLLDEEKRDLEHDTECINPRCLGWRVTSTDPGGRYRIHKEFIADPHQACILVRVRFEADNEWAGRLKCFVLMAPHLQVGGHGNSAMRHFASGRQFIAAWKGDTHLALGASTDFVRTSCGYVGESDGYTDLADNWRMDYEFERATDGNVACTGEIDLDRGPFTIGLAFGRSRHAAVTRLLQSLSLGYGGQRERFYALRPCLKFRKCHCCRKRICPGVSKCRKGA